jgi:hypothetical protein
VSLRAGIALALLALTLACGGSKAVGDKAGAVNSTLQILPAVVELAPGQSLQFSANGNWNGGLTWAVLPTTAGTITSSGVFTASTSQGPVQILAVWNQDARYTATAQATILPPPPPADSTPTLVSANGAKQGSSSGTSQNASVAGESVPAATATDAAGHSQLRHGFSLQPR